MAKTALEVAQLYYQAVAEKKLDKAVVHFDQNIVVISPFVFLQGKEKVTESVENFIKLFNELTICKAFGDGNEAVVQYDVVFPAPIGVIRSASLVTVKDGLIVHAEIFFDARPFEKK